MVARSRTISGSTASRSGRDALVAGVIEGAQRHRRRMVGAVHLDGPLGVGQPLRCDRVAVRLDHGEPHGAADRMAVRAGPHVPDGSSGAADDLGVVEQRFGVEQLHRHEPTRQGAGVTPGKHRLAPHETARLVECDREPETGLEWTVGVVDVVAVVAVALLQAQARQRLQPGVP